MIDVRRAGEHEHRAVRDVRLRALRDAPGAFASSLSREQAYDADEWRRRIAASAWFLARDDGRIVGVACGIDDPGETGARHLVGMWVEPAHRGGPAAPALLAAVLGWARDDGADALALWVVDGNERARRCYERAGFVATGERQPLPSDGAVMESRMRRALLTADPRCP